jgi:release factor glutamine methyltransferase
MGPAELARTDLTPMTAGTAAVRAAVQLREARSPTPRLDAELLVAHAFGRDRAWLLAHPEAPVNDEAADQLDGWVSRRAQGEPVAYIRGFKEWFSLHVRTDRRALIPRPETELLVEAAIAEIVERLARDSRQISVWEVGTGSGAVILALALRFRTAVALGRIRLAASDASADALELAAENLAAQGVGGLVSLACADLLDPAGRTLPLPDVVVANLPYVASDEVDERCGSLRYEPRGALDGGRDGLDVLRRLLEQLPRMADDGVALLEIGAEQAPAIVELALPGTLVSFTPDLAGIERVVRIARL